MSTFEIDRFRQDGRTLLLSTGKTFISSSLGVTGSETLSKRTSKNLRDITHYGNGAQYGTQRSSQAIDSALRSIASARTRTSSVSTEVDYYMSIARAQSREDEGASIVFAPTVFAFDPAAGNDELGSLYSQKKYARRILSSSLVPYYLAENQGKFFAVGNYFTHNFFTGSSVAEQTGIVFPDFDASHPTYAVNSGLTIDLHINPRYSSDGRRSEFRAGTIVHVPGCYSLSMVSGSSKGPDGRPDSFRLVLALTHSADVPPAQVDLTVANGSRAAPQDAIYVSDDNILPLNTWNHVSVKWDAYKNGGVGKFMVNGEDTGLIENRLISIARSTRPGCLVVGNHLTSSALGERFFNSEAAARNGIASSNSFSAGDPTTPFTSPLNAEIHSLKVYNRHIPDEQTLLNMTSDVPPEKSVIFYMPPIFMHESPSRYFPISLFEKGKASTNTPINLDLMHTCGGRDINLENFCRDLTRFGSIISYPRLYNLTSSIKEGGTYDSSERNFNNIFYRSGENRKRNLTVLPNDDGSFRLNYSCIASLSVATGSFVSYKGALDYTHVAMTGQGDPIPATSPIAVGNTRKDPGGQTSKDTAKGQTYGHTQYEDQEDCVTFGSLIDISTMHYAHRIQPGSFMITDSSLTGSDSRIRITYKDDGRNALYRADANTLHAKWNTQGLLYGNEGLGIVLSPTVPFFGKEQWKMQFSTDATVHVHTMDVYVPAGTANISQNPTHRKFAPTSNGDETAKDFVYIDTINLHDENLNVVARATLAQPLLKRPDEAFLFRLKMDY